MTLALRYPVSVVVVVVALFATAAVFTVARPRYQPAVEVENVDLAKERHVSVSDVRAAFAAEGIRLAHTKLDASSGMTWLGVRPSPGDEKDLYVTVLPEKGVFGLGHGEWEDGIFEQRVGNVLVHYGGADEKVLERVKRAVGSLRPAVAARGAGFLRG